jgi:hypothetical protein
MNKFILGVAAAAATLLAGSAMAQQYGYPSDRGGYDSNRSYGYEDNRGYDNNGGFSFSFGRARDSDGDGIPDRAEWNQDRDHDGRPDQWDRHDNRRDHHRRHYEHSGSGYDRWDDNDGRYERYNR